MNDQDKKFVDEWMENKRRNVNRFRPGEVYLEVTQDIFSHRVRNLAEGDFRGSFPDGTPLPSDEKLKILKQDLEDNQGRWILIRDYSIIKVTDSLEKMKAELDPQPDDLCFPIAYPPVRDKEREKLRSGRILFDD